MMCTEYRAAYDREHEVFLKYRKKSKWFMRQIRMAKKRGTFFSSKKLFGGYRSRIMSTNVRIDKQLVGQPCLGYPIPGFLK
jgi:hypothetical protein